MHFETMADGMRRAAAALRYDVAVAVAAVAAGAGAAAAAAIQGTRMNGGSAKLP